MRKIFIILALLTAVSAGPAGAFLYEIEILSTEQIAALADQKLVEAYTEAKIEEKTSAEFVQAAGFSSAKDYDKRKDLLRYIINLRREMSKRNIEPDPIEDWLK